MTLKLGILTTALFFSAFFNVGAFAISQQPLINALQEQDKREASRISEAAFKESSGDPEAEFWVNFVAPHSPEGTKAWGLLRSKDATNPWGLLGKATHNPLTAADLVTQASAKASGDPSLLQACVLTLMSLEQESSDLRPLASFLEDNKIKFDGNSDLLVTEAFGHQFLSGSTVAPNAKKDMLAELDKALELDPHNEEAELFKGRQSRNLGNAGLYAFLQKSAPNFPNSYPIQAELWTSGLAQENLKEAEPVIRASIVAMMERNQPSIPYLRLSYQATASHPETASGFEDAVLAKYPNTAIADEVLFRRADKELPQGTPEQNTAARIAGLEAFIQRPHHPDPSIVKYAYERLEPLLASQDNPDLAALYNAVENAPGLSRGLRILARKKYRLPDLERISISNLNQPWVMLDEYSETSRDVTGFVGFVLGDYVNFYETSLGLVYFEERKLPQAQAALELAAELNKANSETTTLLAQVYQSKGDFAKAQSLMLEALNQPHYGLPKNPALAALPELYKAQHHSTVGLDDFMKPLLAKAKEDNRLAIVADRDRDPKPVPVFKFVDTAGRPVSSDDYKGKILIVNFWATWCGPCRAEFPDFQKFYEKYKDDPRVAVLAVATDETATPTSTITTYIDKNKFTFPVARSGDYSTENHINSIPMTWWIDPSGKVIYRKLGRTEDLVEEYTWRIDAMEKATAVSSGHGTGK
jgi:thiol-disulfide isomerase/thioredoxin